jgi:AraC-like DNA-binding protein
MRTKKEDPGSRAGRAESLAPLPVQEALDRLSLLDIPGAAEAFDRWLGSLGPEDRFSSGAASLLIDAASRASRIARGLDPRAGLPDPSLTLFAQRLRHCGTYLESVKAFRETMGEIFASLSRTPKVSEPVARARDFIATQFRRKISLAEVARVAGISPNYLSTRFRQECGTTVVQFVHEMRVEEAAKLLSGGGKRVSEVAYMVGYQTYRDFHRNFVRLRRDPPGTFIAGARRRSSPGGSAPQSDS